MPKWPRLMVAFMLVFAAGCSGAPSVVPANPTNGTAPAANGGGCLAMAPSPSSTAKRFTVRRVVDGDTVVLDDGTTTRILGVNTPETVDPRRPVEFYGKEASAFTKTTLTGKSVTVEPGTQPKDKYGRLLAWLWLEDGRFFNGVLVAEGYAQVSTYSDNPEHADLLNECQREAMGAKRGLWADEPGAAPGSDGVKITKEPGTVPADGNVSVTAQTTPGADCSITVTYKGGPSTAQGLAPKQADSSGVVSWSWKVGARTASGTWPVAVNCAGKTARTNVTVR